jgi:hypothetical protein
MGPAQPTAWQITFTFTTPFTVPCEGSYYYGAEIGPATLSPPNGQSIHGATYRQTTPPSMGDNPRPGMNVPNHGYFFLLGGTAATSLPLVFQFSVLHGGSVLNVGGIDPTNVRQPPATSNYGAGGMYPDISGNPRADGLDARIRDINKAGGPAFLFLARSRGITGPLLIAGINGRFRMDVITLIGPFVGVMNFPGEAQIPLAMPAGISPALIGATVYMQGVTIDSGLTTIHFTNVAAVNF